MRKIFDRQSYKSFYDECWYKYPEDEIVESSKHGQQRICETVNIFNKYITKDAKIIIDLGTGAGIMALNICKLGFDLKIIGLDIALNSVNKLLIKAKRVEFNDKTIIGLVGDVCDLPLTTNSVDRVIACEIIEHVLNPFQAASEIIRILKPDGIAIVTTPNSLCVSFRRPLSILKYFLYHFFGFSFNRASNTISTSSTMESYGVEKAEYIHGSYSPRGLKKFFSNFNNVEILETGSIVMPNYRFKILRNIYRTIFKKDSGIWGYIVLRKLKQT